MKNLTKSLLALFVFTASFTIVDKSAATKEIVCPKGKGNICYIILGGGENGQDKVVEKRKGSTTIICPD